MGFYRESDENFAGYILEYFLRNPKASDTLEGVARWRLLDQAVRYALDDTRRALDTLVAKGYLTRKRIPGSGDHFSLNESMRAQAEKSVHNRKRRDRRKGPES